MKNDKKQITFPSKKSTIREFLKDNSFYLVLAVCMVVIAILTYRLVDDAVSFYSQANMEEGITTAENTVPEALKTVETAPPVSAVAQKPQATQAPLKTQKASPAPQTSAKPKTADNKMIWPVHGEVITAFAKDSLVYSKTLSEWHAHLGADIAASKGAQVKAVLDGTVQEITNDPTYGTTITIDHKNGLVMKYSNLSTDKMVKVGDHVEKGQIISGIGDSAKSEISEPPHLHLEAFQKGEVVDPLKLLKP